MKKLPFLVSFLFIFTAALALFSASISPASADHKTLKSKAAGTTSCNSEFTYDHDTTPQGIQVLFIRMKDTRMTSGDHELHFDCDGGNPPPIPCTIGADGVCRATVQSIYGDSNSCIFGGRDATNGVELWPQGGNEPVCSGFYPVSPEVTGAECTLSASPKSLDVTMPVTISGNSVPSRALFLKITNLTTNQVIGGVINISVSGGTFSKNIGRLERPNNQYQIEVQDINGTIKECKPITLSPGEAGKPLDQQITFGGAGKPKYCPGGETHLSTAIGCIPITDTNEFAAFALKWAIGLAGGVAFLLIIAAAFKIMTARGNPEQLQGGRELLTAAISGLILIIFSVFLLQLIGVEILQIPGFG